MSSGWSPGVRALVFVGTLVGLIWLAVVVGPLLDALIIAGLLAYLLDPLAQLLERKTRLKRVWAVRLVYGLFLLVLASIPTAVGAIAVGQFRRLQDNLAQAADGLRVWFSQPVYLLGYALHPQAFLDNLGQFAQDLLVALPRGSFGLLSGATSNLYWGIVVLVTLYYLLADGPQIKGWLVGLAPESHQPELHRILNEVNQVWAVFLRAQLLITAILTLLIVIGTLLVIWLFQAGLLAFSPILFLVLLILVYAAAQQVDNLWLHPQLMGRRLRLHPGVVFVGLAGALALSGVLGAIIVVPCIATAKVMGRYVRCKLLGLDPWADSAESTIPPSDRAGPGGATPPPGESVQ